MSNDNKYLIKRKNRDVWLFSKRVPKHLKHLYEGKDVYTKSLQTACIKTARKRRDVLLADMRIKEEHSIDGGRHTFVAFYNSLKWAKEHYGKDPRDAYWTLDLEDLVETDKFPEIQRDAKLAVESGVIPTKYTHTLRETLNDWLRKNGHKHKDTISKSKSTVDKFLAVTGSHDIPLLEIDRKAVVAFIDEEAKAMSASTIRGHLSRLRTIYRHAWDMGFIKDKENPFEEHSLAHLEADQETQQRNLFTNEQLQKIARWADAETAKGSSYGLLFRLGLFTGCRISELCALKVKDIYTENGITALLILKGKTEAARRTVPLTDSLAEEVLSLASTKSDEDSLLGLNNEKAIRTFSNYKTKHITKDRTRTFHSLRVHTSTAFLRAGVPEERSAFIIGHAGGKTMTYGYYAKGDELSRLKQYVDSAESVIIRDWLIPYKQQLK